MKEVEIRDTVRRFQQAIQAYAELERELEQARLNVAEAAERYPALARAHQLFRRAALRLEVIGAAVADVPGLVGEVEERQQRLVHLRRLAERHGLEVRYHGLPPSREKATGPASGEDFGNSTR